MSADQNKPRFEPPPWEREAFDQFQTQLRKSRAAEELESELQAIREEPPVSPTQDDATEQPATQLGAVTDANAPTGVSVPPVAATSTVPATARIPEERIDVMLVQLRGEEAPSIRRNMKLINGAMAFMMLGGVLLIVQATRLFAQASSQGAEGAGLMIAGSVSLLVLITGAAFIGGAYMLFRKYHR